jgi:hypothetical protein
MKTIPLRQLVREPLKVKRWTRSGEHVQVTDNGKPLWIIHPAVTKEDEERRGEEIEEILDEVMAEKRPATTKLSAIIRNSRR